MIVSASALAWLVGIALVVAVAAPLLLILLFIRDKYNGSLW